MKGIVITTENEVSVKDFGEPLYQTVGEAVGGYIEHVNPMYLPDPYCMIVNEEGVLQSLDLNFVGCILYGTPEHDCPIMGNIVLMKDGFKDGEPDIIGLDEEDIHTLGNMLEHNFSLKGTI